MGDVETLMEEEENTENVIYIHTLGGLDQLCRSRKLVGRSISQQVNLTESCIDRQMHKQTDRQTDR